MSEEWGPWIEHDGKGCPCVGKFIHTVFDAGLPREIVGLLNEPGERLAWYWDKPRAPVPGKIIRYRIRKPKGLKILEGILADLPASSPEAKSEVWE